MKRGRRGFFVLLILSGACELDQVTIPAGDEVLIVHAIMRPDYQRQFVLVEGSWRGDMDPAELDHFDMPPNGPQLPIEGATVTVTNVDLPNDPCGSPVIFPEVGRGLFQGPANCPTMRPGDHLVLRIDTPNGDSVLGTTEVPGLDSASVRVPLDSARFGMGDSLGLNRDVDTLLVSVQGGSGRIVELQVNRIDYYGDLSTSAFDRTTIFADSADLTVPASIVDLLERGEGDPIFRAGRNYLMNVGMADQNYYDFVRSQNNELTGRGFINHLDGAIGVFGSLVSSEVDVTAYGDLDDEREGHYRMAGQIQGVDVDVVFSMYLHASEDSAGVSAFMNGTWAIEGETGLQAWDPRGSSHDGTYDGSALELTIEQPQMTMRGERPSIPFLVSGFWAPDSFQVVVSDDAVFLSRTLAVLWAVKQ